MAHFASARGITEVQVHAIGPFQLTYVHPEDDPTARRFLDALAGVDLAGRQLRGLPFFLQDECFSRKHRLKEFFQPRRATQTVRPTQPSGPN